MNRSYRIFSTPNPHHFYTGVPPPRLLYFERKKKKKRTVIHYHDRFVPVQGKVSVTAAQLTDS